MGRAVARVPSFPTIGLVSFCFEMCTHLKTKRCQYNGWEW